MFYSSIIYIFAENLIFIVKLDIDMAKKIIRLTEDELKEIVKGATQQVLEERSLLTEMPYERNDFVYVVDKDARNAYLHLAKLILYKNSTNDANKWINDIVNNFTIPMLTAKVFVSNKARSKVLCNGYVKNLFGGKFEDYDTQMKNFCIAAIKDMEHTAMKANLAIPIHDDIGQSMQIGKNIVITYANAVSALTYRTITQEVANEKLQTALRDAVNKTFGLNV